MSKNITVRESLATVLDALAAVYKGMSRESHLVESRGPDATHPTTGREARQSYARCGGTPGGDAARGPVGAEIVAQQCADSPSRQFRIGALPALLTGPRRYGLLIASRSPIHPREPGCFDVPYPERILSVDLETACGQLEMHTTHIPPGVTNGWIKIEMLEGLYAGLAHPTAIPRLLWGDFNTPQLDRSTGEVVTWGQRLNSKGLAVIRQHLRGGEGARWNQGERQVLQGLATYDLHDAYRRLHGYAMQAYSGYPHRKDPHRQAQMMWRRFDHGFASASLYPVSCMYLHAFRELGLSDHAALEIVFRPELGLARSL